MSKHQEIKKEIYKKIIDSHRSFIRLFLSFNLQQYVNLPPNSYYFDKDTELLLNAKSEKVLCDYIDAICDIDDLAYNDEECRQWNIERIAEMLNETLKPFLSVTIRSNDNIRYIISCSWPENRLDEILLVDKELAEKDPKFFILPDLMGKEEIVNFYKNRMRTAIDMFETYSSVNNLSPLQRDYLMHLSELAADQHNQKQTSRTVRKYHDVLTALQGGDPNRIFASVSKHRNPPLVFSKFFKTDGAKIFKGIQSITAPTFRPG